MNDPLDLLTHARLDAVYLTPETGLVCLILWCAGAPGSVRRLGVGVGTRVVGLGWLPRAPTVCTDARHPLVAALKAHAVGRSVRSVTHDDLGAVCVTFGEPGALTSLHLQVARAGEAKLTGAAGEVIVAWHPERVRPPGVCEPAGDFDDVGAELVRVSDALAMELRRGALAKGLRAHLRKLARRREAVEEDLTRLDDVARLQRTGRLLLAQGGRIARGATHATLDDWEEGGTLDVTLDPAVPAKLQAEGFFAKAKRIARGEAMMRTRLDETTRAIDAVRALEAEVRDAEALSLDLLTTWTTRARSFGLREHEVSAQRGSSRRGARVPYLEYTAHGGQRVLVGRGAADNDALTLRIARPHDVWMHTRGTPGAHVVVPLARGTQCAQEALLDAATLAAHHSDARGHDFVEVTWTERRYVRKPRKSKPGSVVLDREKVLALRPEAARLARLLASRREGA
jgi:hypothetical protein